MRERSERMTTERPPGRRASVGQAAKAPGGAAPGHEGRAKRAHDDRATARSPGVGGAGGEGAGGAQPPGTMSQPSFDFEYDVPDDGGLPTFTVGELVGEVNAVLRQRFYEGIWVRGEIQGF